MTGIGPVAVRQPRIRDREAIEGERIRFSPTILPPYARRTKSLEVLIPILYLKGISTGLSSMIRFLVAITLALSSTTAFAADLLNYRPSQVPPISPAFNWTGLHIGVSGGYKDVGFRRRPRHLRPL